MTTEEEPIRYVFSQEQYLEHFDSYIEQTAYDFGLFRDSAAPPSSKTEKKIPRELSGIWIIIPNRMSRHP